MVDAPLLTEGEWEAAVAKFDGTLHNPRIDDEHYVADFYVCADIFVDDSASKYAKCQAVAELKQSLTAALHAHDILKPVFVTVEPEWGWNLIFCNLHFPMDGQAQTRLEKAAEVVRTWRREKKGV